MPGSLDYPTLLAGFGSATYPSLLPAQDAVLSRYAETFHGSTDVGIELPTGAGKSLIALLIAEAWRRDGQSAVVLTANKTLASQMEAQATLLGVPTSRLEGSRDDIPSPAVRVVNRARAIGVMNYWVYFNQNPVLDIADLVIMDDVHLADGALQSLFSVEVTRRDHPQLFQRLVEHLAGRFPGYPGVRDAANGTDDPLSPTDLIAPHDHLAVIDELGTIITGSQPTGDLRFRWARARTHVDAMHLYVSSDQLVLRPHIWPLQEFAYYRETTQRIYLSATLGSVDDLQRRLGSLPIERIPVDDSHTKPLGRRLIVLNETDNDSYVNSAVTAATELHPKSLWLTRSHAAKERYAESLDAADFEPIWQLTSNGNEAADFAAAPEGHLICAGRYDGIDLPGDACRLVVVTELPRAIDLQEQFLTEQLRDAAFMLERLNARIVQALGRANRSDDDFAVYVLYDPRFASHLQRDANRVTLPVQINAEIDVAQDSAREADDEIAARVKAFLQRDFVEHDRAVSEAATAGMPGPQAPTTISATDEVEGWRRMYVEDFVGARDAFADWARACQTAGLREQTAFALVCQARAHLLASRDGDLRAQATARDLIEQAIGAGGIRSTWFNGLRASIMPREPSPVATSESVDQMLTKFDLRAVADGGNSSKFERQRARVAKKLADGSHAEFQEGMEELGRLLGFDAVRPKGNAATDVRWDWTETGQRHLLVWEAKIEHEEHNALSVGYVDQANGQLTAARTEYGPRGFSCRGALVSHLEPDASAAGRLGDVTLISKDAACDLWDRAADLYARYLAAWLPDDADARRQAVARVEGLTPPTGWLTRALDKNERLDSEALLAEWP